MKGWVLYDGDCGFCSRWVPFWETTLKRRGVRIAPLQADWVAEKFALCGDELTADLRLFLADGETRAGAEVYRYLMRRIWWATPLYLLSQCQYCEICSMPPIGLLRTTVIGSRELVTCRRARTLHDRVPWFS